MLTRNLHCLVDSNDLIRQIPEQLFNVPKYNSSSPFLLLRSQTLAFPKTVAGFIFSGHRDSCNALLRLLHLRPQQGRNKCPRQINNSDFGLYVMRFMKEIIDQNALTISREYFPQHRCPSYTTEQLDEVREEWAKHVVTTCM